MKDALTKDQAVQALINLGYDAYRGDGVVMIYVDLEDYLKNSLKVKKRIERDMANIGYFSSWGIKPSSAK